MSPFKKIRLSVESIAFRAGYGKGFWTLIIGLFLATGMIYSFESSKTASHPIQIERIPASE